MPEISNSTNPEQKIPEVKMSKSKALNILSDLKGIYALDDKVFNALNGIYWFVNSTVDLIDFIDTMEEIISKLKQHVFTLQSQDWKEEVIQEIENSKMEISDMINDAFDGENLFPTQVTLNTISKKLITKIKEM
jgi:glutamyl/glutaminyl-tRNA synthetase